MAPEPPGRLWDGHRVRHRSHSLWHHDRPGICFRSECCAPHGNRPPAPSCLWVTRSPSQRPKAPHFSDSCLPFPTQSSFVNFSLSWPVADAGLAQLHCHMAAMLPSPCCPCSQQAPHPASPMSLQATQRLCHPFSSALLIPGCPPFPAPTQTQKMGERPTDQIRWEERLGAQSPVPPHPLLPSCPNPQLTKARVRASGSGAGPGPWSNDSVCCVCPALQLR